MPGLVLVGYRASGKSTIGRLVAARLAWPFVDADHEWETQHGAIRSFFAEHGEAAFRERESAVLADLLARPRPWVLATGGGAVLAERNRQALAAWGGPVVYLQAPAPYLADRLRHDAGGRPSLTGQDVADEVTSVLSQRDPWYRAVATAIVDATKPMPIIADDVVAVVEKFAQSSSKPPRDSA
jgi:shikimate kinase